MSVWCTGWTLSGHSARRCISAFPHAPRLLPWTHGWLNSHILLHQFGTGLPPALAVAVLHSRAEPVFIGIEEKLNVVLSKTGGLESLEVQGTMSLVVGNDADAYVNVQVRVAPGAVQQWPGAVWCRSPAASRCKQSDRSLGWQHCELACCAELCAPFIFL